MNEFSLAAKRPYPEHHPLRPTQGLGNSDGFPAVIGYASVCALWRSDSCGVRRFHDVMLKVVICQR